jgi:xylono-1,5-lactonase
MEWEVLAHGYGLCEAPTIDADGTLVFSDVLGGGIYRLASDRTVSAVVPKRRGVGGIAVHGDGGIVCSGRDIVHIASDGETRVVLHVDGVAGWNDLCTNPDGEVYAGALRFAVFDPAAEEVAGELWDVGAERIVFGDVIHANGVACTPEGKIYLSDTRAQRVIVYEHGTRRDIDMAQFGHPDGMALDEDGALWLALVGGGLGRFGPDGALDALLDVPSTMTTSVCFDGRDLYVTTGAHREQPELRGCVLRTTVDIAGMPVTPARI